MSGTRILGCWPEESKDGFSAGACSTGTGVLGMLSALCVDKGKQNGTHG